MRGAMHIEPVFRQALQPCDAMANFVIQNFGTAAGDGIESGIAQARNRVANGEPTVLCDCNDFRSRIAVQMDFETLFDSAQHFFMPIDFEVGMQASLHKHAGSAKLDRLTNFVVDRIEIENVSLFSLWPFQRTIERAERAIFGAEVCVIDVAVNDVADNA